MSSSNLENRRKAARLACRARAVFHPRAACAPGAAGTRDSGLPHTSARANFIFGDVQRQLHDEAVFHQADEEPPAGITGWKAKHAADSKAAVMLDEFREEWLQISSKRNRHGTCDCKLLLLLLQQPAFSLDTPAVAAKSAVLLHDPVAGNDETDAVGRAGSGHGAS